MNPNLAQSLDPKLKETYDRIMGTRVNVQSPKPVVPAPQPSPQEHVPVEGVAPVSTSAPAAKEEKPEMVNINISSSSPAPTAKAASSKKMSPIIFVVAGVGFFLVYTVVWLKIFGII